MLIDPEFQQSLEALPAEGGRKRVHRTRDDAAPRGGIGAWRLARKGEGRSRSRLERLFSRLFVPYDLELTILLDASLAMTYTGFAPPAPSEKFDYARKLAAALSYAALCHYGSVRTLAFSPAKGRRAPILRDKSAIGDLTDYLESVEPGGNTNFSATLRNALARGDDRSVYVILSDFADANWERGIRALMHGTSRIVLIQLHDDGLPATSDLTGDETDERRRYQTQVLAELRRRLAEMARQNDLEHFPLASGTPFEEALLRALGATVGSR